MDHKLVDFELAFGTRKKICKICKLRDVGISGILGICVDCIKEKSEDAYQFIINAHKSSRKLYGLTPFPSKKSRGIRCNICANDCVILEGEKGYCGLRRVEDGRLVSLVDSDKGLLHTYPDPHVTNCCASWFCPGGIGSGYPHYAYSDRKPEYGYNNFSAFLYGCNFDCLFCQNSSHKKIEDGVTITANEFSKKVLSNSRYSCICYFGGSPEPQLPFVINISKKIDEKKIKNRIIRFCFEWNGCGNQELVRKAAEISLNSGGNMKFDLKCFNPSLSMALSGVSNETAYKNFEMIARDYYEKRDNLPMLTATTLLVPHYVDVVEIECISKFIAELDSEIPYSLLIFHPDHFMSDLPITPKKQVEECYTVAKRYLRNVHIGNIHLLGLGRMHV